MGNVVMNALWFPESYKPTKGQPEVEPNPGKLTRECVLLFHQLTKITHVALAVSGPVAYGTQARVFRNGSSKPRRNSTSLSVSKPRHVLLMPSRI